MARPESVRRDLVGVNTRRARRTIAVAVSLFPGFLTAFLAVEASGLLPQAFVYATDTAVVVSLVTLSVGLFGAAVTGYRDGGLVVSWLLVLSPFSAWVLVSTGVSGSPSVTLLFAGVAAVLVSATAGTLGYAAGYHLNARSSTRNRPMGPALRAFVGASPARARWWCALSGVLTLFAVCIESIGSFGLLLPVVSIGQAPLVVAGSTLCWVALTAVPGTRSDGLLSSWLLVFGPSFGALFTESVTDEFSDPSVLVSVQQWLLYSFLLALLVGTAGYLVGATLDHLSDGRLVWPREDGADG